MKIWKSGHKLRQGLQTGAFSLVLDIKKVLILETHRVSKIRRFFSVYFEQLPNVH